MGQGVSLFNLGQREHNVGGGIRPGVVLKKKLKFHCKGLVINYGEGGGGYNMGKSRVRNSLRPPPLKTG